MPGGTGPFAWPLCLCALLAQAAAQAQPGDAPEPAAPDHRAVIVGSAATGVDPIVARYVDRAMARAATDLGYEVTRLPAPEGGEASPAALWRIVHEQRAAHALSAVTTARAGKYLFQLRVASADGSGPRYAQDATTEVELETAVATAVARTLPPPGAAAAAAPLASAPPAATRSASTKDRRSASPAAPPPPELPHLRLALRDELVAGLGRADFVGAIVAAGGDLRVHDALYAGVRVGYANLPGTRGRAHATLWYLQIVQQIELDAPFFLPVKGGLGYLANNGSVLRLSSGLGGRLSRDVSLAFDLLAPTFWVTPDTTLFSLDLAVELVVEL